MDSKTDELTEHYRKIGMTQMQRAEARRRIAEIAFQRVQLQNEATELREDLKYDREKFSK